MIPDLVSSSAGSRGLVLALLAALAPALVSAAEPLSIPTPAAPALPIPARPDGRPADLSKPVQVFILMGQSNMLGFGKISPSTTEGTLEHACHVRGLYPFLRDDAGKWIVRQDVRHTFVMPSRGGGMQVKLNDWLTIKGNIGPEIGFGHVVGEALDAPVLLLKSCIGNRGLGWDLLPPGSQRFEHVQKDKQGVETRHVYAGYKDRPPSWPMDPARGLRTDPPAWVDKQGKPVDWYAGKQYDDDVANAKAVLKNLATHYPGAKSFEIAGFVWWQGHKDQGEPYASRYEANLVRLIDSLRKDFDAPVAKMVIATGCGNPGTSGGGLKVAQAQLAVSGESGKYPALKGLVKSVDTRAFWPTPEHSPTRAEYHYCHNATTYMNTGLALGAAMVELLRAQP